MIYEMKCETCGKHADVYIRLAAYSKEINRQTCECGGHMIQVITPPTLKGMDSGPAGFMRGRIENDGCVDEFTRRRVERNLGHKLNGGVFVPGLCPQGEGFSAKAVCHSRNEVIQKARKLGVAVRGPGINVEPRISDAAYKEREEQDSKDYVPSEQAMRTSIAQEIREKHGGKVTRKQYRKIVEELGEKHGQKRQPPPKIDSIYGDPSICAKE